MSSDHQRGDMYVYWTRRARGYTPGGGVWNEYEYIVLSLIREWSSLRCYLAGMMRFSRSVSADGDRFQVTAHDSGSAAHLQGRNPYVLGDLIATTPASLGLDFAKLPYGFAYPPQAISH